jgi:S1-C subfamily serine protease
MNVHPLLLAKHAAQRYISSGHQKLVVLSGVILLLLSIYATVNVAVAQVHEAIETSQPRMVKIFGVGGLQRLESYQTGVLISPDGHILTTYGYILNTDALSVSLDDGRRFQAELLGADPRLEIAVLRIEAHGLPYFMLTESINALPGTPILALSNLFGLAVGEEQCSVQQGIISAQTTLSGRRGSYETPYQGPIYVLDAITSNPGSAGGAVIDYEGRLLGIIGKELQDSRTDVWFNYAIPIRELKPSVMQILSEQSSPWDATAQDPNASLPDQYWTLEQLGAALVPDVLLRTPPYIDIVREGSLAADEGLQPDDLVVQIEGRIVQSAEAASESLRRIDILDPLRITVLRENELIELEFAPQR